MAERCQDLGSGAKTWELSGQYRTWVFLGIAEPKSWVSLIKVKVVIIRIRCFLFNEGNSLTDKFGAQLNIFSKNVIYSGTL